MTPTELVRNVIDWKWPHVTVVYPRHGIRPVVNTREQRLGRKRLLHVYEYLLAVRNAELGGDHYMYRGVDLRVAAV